MSKDDYFVAVLFIGLLLIFMFAPDLYNPSFLPQ